MLGTYKTIFTYCYFLLDNTLYSQSLTNSEGDDAAPTPPPASKPREKSALPPKKIFGAPQSQIFGRRLHYDPDIFFS